VVLLDAAPLGPLQLNATFLVELIAFLVMLGILARWVYPVVIAAAEERQNRIKQQLEQAEQSRNEAEQSRRQAEAEIQKAREQAGQIIERANRAGERVEQEAQEKAREEARRIVEGASRDIEAERQRAVHAIRQQMADIVEAAVGKIVGDSLDGERHRKLIDAAIDQVEKEPSASK
jgi:F-type H+-transporting ATPase subunit b